MNQRGERSAEAFQEDTVAAHNFVNTNYSFNRRYCSVCGMTASEAAKSQDRCCLRTKANLYSCDICGAAEGQSCINLKTGKEMPTLIHSAGNRWRAEEWR